MSEELIKRIEQLEAENKKIGTMLEKTLKMFDSILTFVESTNKINQVLLSDKLQKVVNKLNN